VSCFFRHRRTVVHRLLLHEKFQGAVSKTHRVSIDFAAIHHEHKHVTLQLLWEEYCKNRADNADGSPDSYTRLCELYHDWRDVVLRQDRRAGEKDVSWTGRAIPTYESKPACLFVAVRC